MSRLLSSGHRSVRALGRPSWCHPARPRNGFSGVVGYGAAVSVRRPLVSVSLVLAALLTAAPLLAPAASAQRAAEPGAAGIGDPYYPLDGNGGIDVTHYAIDVTYAFAPVRLSGTTTLTVRAKQDLSSFHLDFLLPVDSVQVDGVDATFAKPDEHELEITPAAPLVKGSETSVVVSYDADPSAVQWANPAEPSGESNWLASGDEVVAMNEPHMAPWWFPSNDHPRDKATFDISITTDATKTVVANGELQGDPVVSGNQATTTWQMDQPMATYLAYFAAGDFAVNQGTTDGIPWYTAVSKQFAAPQRREYRRVVKRSGAITSWLQGELGDYPFGSTGGVVTALNAGFALENQSRPTYSGGIGKSTEVHELAHQWFGDSVSVRRWRDIWLNEGFATYLEMRYHEAHCGPSTAVALERQYRFWRDHPAFWEVDLADPGARIGQLFHWAVYDRGAMALAALRTKIGKRTFDRLLRDWASDHRFGTATVAMFEDAAERASGRDLGRFFHVWLRAPRPPAHTAANGFAPVRGRVGAARLPLRTGRP